jgi:hypothetical protein
MQATFSPPKLQFNDSYGSLAALVARIDPNGEWRDLGHAVQYRSCRRGILNWWPGTKTVFFQGPHPAARDFRLQFEAELRRYISVEST